MVAITQMILSMIILSSVHGDRVWFGNNNTVGASSQQQMITQNYESHNIFIVNGTTVTLDGYTITAPSKNDDGEDAVRVEDATFIAKLAIFSRNSLLVFPKFHIYSCMRLLLKRDVYIYFIPSRT